MDKNHRIKIQMIQITVEFSKLQNNYLKKSKEKETFRSCTRSSRIRRRPADRRFDETPLTNCRSCGSKSDSLEIEEREVASSDVSTNRFVRDRKNRSQIRRLGRRSKRLKLFHSNKSHIKYIYGRVKLIGRTIFQNNLLNCSKLNMIVQN